MPEPRLEPLAPEVSIRAAREGSDLAPLARPPGDNGFNPRCPRGQRLSTNSPSTSTPCFNPRCPRGQRLLALAAQASADLFQSALPARAAMSSLCAAFHGLDVSIRAAREGSDPTSVCDR